MSPVRVVAILPARMAAGRFPGKPLVEVRGLPMIEHVRRRALRCRGFSEVVVATCDHEIAHVVQRGGGRVVMTSAMHPAATDRVAEAARALDCTHVVNVQGDELLVLPEDLEAMVRAIVAEPEIPAWNAVGRIERAEELADRAIVKCALSLSGRILYCAREFSGPASWRGSAFEPIRSLLGVLGYRRDFLQRYAALSRTPIELAESIDQSRIIEHDIVLRAVEFSRGYPGINEPHEVAVAQRYLEEDPKQQTALAAVLRG